MANEIAYCPLCLSKRVQPTLRSDKIWRCRDCKWEGPKSNLSKGE